MCVGLGAYTGIGGPWLWHITEPGFRSAKKTPEDSNLEKQFNVLTPMSSHKISAIILNMYNVLRRKSLFSLYTDFNLFTF